MLHPNDSAQGRSPLATARPYLMSLSVADLDLSVRWYCEMLGFRETRRLIPRFEAAFNAYSGHSSCLVERDGAFELAGRIQDANLTRPEARAGFRITDCIAGSVPKSVSLRLCAV